MPYGFRIAFSNFTSDSDSNPSLGMSSRRFSLSSNRSTIFFFFSSRRRHTRSDRDWSSDVCSSDLLVVEVPRTAGLLRATLAAQPGEYAQIAAVTTSADGSVTPRTPIHIFVNPAVFSGLEARGSQVVMSHEAVHVATDAANSVLPLWLVEGFADYVALRDVRLPLSTTAGQILPRVRQHGAPRHLPGPAEFDTTQTHLGASYEAAWLACRLLAQRYGQGRLVAFYRALSGGA